MPLQDREWSNRCQSEEPCVEAAPRVEPILLNIVLMLSATSGMMAPAATATKPAMRAYSMRSCPRWSFQTDKGRSYFIACAYRRAGRAAISVLLILGAKEIENTWAAALPHPIGTYSATHLATKCRERVHPMPGAVATLWFAGIGPPASLLVAGDGWHRSPPRVFLRPNLAAIPPE